MGLTPKMSINHAVSGFFIVLRFGLIFVPKSVVGGCVK